MAPLVVLKCEHFASVRDIQALHNPNNSFVACLIFCLYGNTGKYKPLGGKIVEGSGILPRSKVCHLYCVILLSWNTTDFVVIIQDLHYNLVSDRVIVRAACC